MAALNEYEVRHLAEHLESLGDLHSLDRILRIEWAEQVALGLPQSGVAAEAPYPRDAARSQFGERARCHLAWFDAKNRFNLAADFVEDVHRAWRLAEKTTDIALAGGAPAPSIRLEIRYAFMSGSVASIAGNLPYGLLAALAEHGIWPPGAALAYARSLASSHDRFHALLQLCPLLPTPQRGQVAAEALAASSETGDTQSQVHALSELGPYLSTDERDRFRAEMLLQARKHYVGTRSYGLLSLLDVVPEGQRDGLLTEALAASRSGVFPDANQEAQVLIQIARGKPAGQRRRVLSEALAAVQRTSAGGVRTSFLLAIAEQHTGLRRWQVRTMALKEARKGKSPAGRCQALADVAERMPARRRHSLFAEALRAVTETDDSGGRVFEDLAKRLPDHLVPAALEVARKVDDPERRSGALVAVARRLEGAAREQVLAEALAAARQIGGRSRPGLRGKALATVALELPADRRPDILAEALAAARAIADEDDLLAVRAALASRLPEPQRDQLQQYVAAATRSIGDPRHRVTVLGDVAAAVSPPLRVELLSEVLDIITTDVKEYRFDLRKLTPYLPEQLAHRALRALQRLQGAERVDFFWAAAVAGLAERLDQESLEEVAEILTITEHQKMYPTFRRLLPLMAQDQLMDIIDLLRLRVERGQAPFQAMIAHYLREPYRGQIQAAVLEYTQSENDPERRSEVLTLLAPSLPEDQRIDTLRDARAAIRELPEPGDRAAALTELAPLIPAKDQLDILAQALADAAVPRRVGGTAGAMAAVATAASACTSATWSPFWRPVLRQAAAENRTEVARQVRTALDDLVRSGGTATPGDALTALDDVVRWWP
jgi:hypothetical protein